MTFASPPARTTVRVLHTLGAMLALTVLPIGAALAADDGPSLTLTIPEQQPTDPTPEPTSTPSPGADPGAGPGTAAPAAVAPRRNGGPSAAADPAPTEVPECTPEEPPVPSTPASSGEAVSTDREVYLPGQEVTATATGFTPGQQVQLVLFTDPQVVAAFTADESGAVQAVVPVPRGSATGAHAVQFTGWCGQIAVGDLLIGSPTGGETGGGVPPWAWWTGGGLGVSGLGVGGWWLLRAMRAPALAPVGLA